MRKVYPADVVLFEGILVLYDPDVRDMLHMKLFVDTDSDTRLARRGQFSLHKFNSRVCHVIFYLQLSEIRVRGGVP